MRNRISFVLAAALVPAAALATETPSVSQYHIENIDVTAIRGLFTPAAATDRIDGVALAPANDLYIIHTDVNGEATILRINPTADPVTGSVVTTSTEIKADLGIVGSVIFEGGLTSSPNGELLYITVSDSASTDLILARVDPTATTKTTALLSGAAVEDLQDIAIHPSGLLVGVRGSAGLGTIDPAAPAWTPRVAQSVFQGLVPTADPAPAEAVAVHPVTGDVYVFCHTILRFYRVTDVATSSPTTTLLNVPGWPVNIDFHDVAVASNGYVFGFDEGNEAIQVWDGASASASHLLDDMMEELEHGHDHSKTLHGTPGSFAPVLWRGIATRLNSEGVPVLYMAMEGDEYGLVMVEFAEQPTSTKSWYLYE